MTRSRDGFTLVELVIVITVTGLLLAIAMPRTNEPERRLSGAVREAWATLNGARQQAVLSQHDILVEFDTETQSILVVHDADNDGTRDADERTSAHRFDGIVFGRGLATAGEIGADAVSFSRPAADEQPRLVFHRNGSASEFGGFYLRTARAESNAFRDEVRLVTVERATGRVSAFDPASGGWTRRF